MQTGNPLRRRLTRRRDYPDAYEINITPVMNLFVSLIPFLLISAVFAQISVIETNAPSRSGGAAQQESSLLMVVIRDNRLTVTGSGKIVKNSASSFEVPKKNDVHDLGGLTELLMGLKANDPEAQELLLMAEPNIEYSLIIDVMDASRNSGDGAPLFPNAFFGGITSAG